MPEYELTPGAEDDLREIGVYTATTWGVAQARIYKAALLRAFDAIARDRAQTKYPIPHRPDVRSCRCEHHYIFSIHEEDAKPVIVAILHEEMDLMNRLRGRLDEGLDDG